MFKKSCVRDVVATNKQTDEETYVYSDSSRCRGTKKGKICVGHNSWWNHLIQVENDHSLEHSTILEHAIKIEHNEYQL